MPTSVAAPVAQDERSARQGEQREGRQGASVRKRHAATAPAPVEVERVRQSLVDSHQARAGPSRTSRSASRTASADPTTTQRQRGREQPPGREDQRDTDQDEDRGRDEREVVAMMAGDQGRRRGSRRSATDDRAWSTTGAPAQSSVNPTSRTAAAGRSGCRGRGSSGTRRRHRTRSAGRDGTGRRCQAAVGGPRPRGSRGRPAGRRPRSTRRHGARGRTSGEAGGCGSRVGAISGRDVPASLRQPPRSNQIRSPANRSVTGSQGNRIRTSSATAQTGRRRRPPTARGWCRSASPTSNTPCGPTTISDSAKGCPGTPRTARCRTPARRRGPSQRWPVDDDLVDAVRASVAMRPSMSRAVLRDRVADPQPLDPAQLGRVERRASRAWIDGRRSRGGSGCIVPARTS